MARRKAGETTRQNAQISFFVEPEIAGEIEAWRFKRGVSIKSEQYREIFLAGLAAKREAWAVEHGNLSRAAVKRATAVAPIGVKSKLGITPKQLAAERRAAEELAQAGRAAATKRAAA